MTFHTVYPELRREPRRVRRHFTLSLEAPRRQPSDHPPTHPRFGQRNFLSSVELFNLQLLDLRPSASPHPRLPLSPLFPRTFAHHVHDRNALNSFPSKRLRTTFFTTAGWGSPASAHFKYHLNSGAFRFRLSTPSPANSCICHTSEKSPVSLERISKPATRV